MSRTALIIFVTSTVILTGLGFGQSRTRVVTSDRQRGWLGVSIDDVTPRLRDRKDLTVNEGAYVTSVVEESPADDAGIRKGDVIVGVDGEKVLDGEDLTARVRAIKPGTEVPVEIVRKSDHKTLTVKIGKNRIPRAFSFDFNGDLPDVHVDVPSVPKLRGFRNLRVFVSNNVYGLEVQPLTKQLGAYFEVPGGKGLLVSAVDAGSDAEKAGFKAGDVITKANGATVREPGDLREELADDAAEKTSTIEIYRKGKPQTLEMRVEKDEGEEGEDEDDDLSSMMGTPPAHLRHRHGEAVIVCPGVHEHLSGLAQLRDNLQAFAGRLRESLHGLRESIRQSLAL